MTSDQFFGRIVDLVRRYDGDELTADAAIGATVLHVGDVGDFDEDGGQLVLGDDDPYNYSSVDADANTIALGDPLVTAATAGDFVKCYDSELGEVVVEYVAHVLMEEQDATDEPIEVTVPHFLVNYLLEEVRGGAAEAVTMVRDGDDDLMIWQVNGKLVNDIAVAEVQGQVTDHDAAIAALNSDLDTLNTVTLPGVDADIAALQGKFPIGSTDISDSAISTPKLAANSVTAAKIVGLTITGDKIAANTISGDKIIVNSIGANQLTANAIDGKTITGATVQTNSGSTSCLRLTGNQILVYNASGGVTWQVAPGLFVVGTDANFNQDLIVGQTLDVIGVSTFESLVRITAGGLLVDGGGAAITGNSTVAGALTASGAVHGNTLWSDADAGGTSSGADIGADGKVKRSTSSQRYKTDIGDAEINVADVLNIVPATYRRIDEDNGPEYLGVIAEQVAETGATHLVFCDGEGQVEGVHYNALTVSLLAVCREQQQQITELETNYAALLARIEALEATP